MARAAHAVRQGLSAASYLGDNTVPALHVLVAHVHEHTGLPITIDETAGRSSPDARQHAAMVDVLWMCGALFTTMHQARELDHEVVAAPVFGGEHEPVYRSVVVARDDGPCTIDQALQAKVAVNELDSWSGHHALRAHLDGRWFVDQVVSGSHVQSVAAVAGGSADCAAIDHTIWHHLCSTDPSMCQGLVVIDRTRDWPSPPFALAGGLDAGVRVRLTQALLSAPALPEPQAPVVNAIVAAKTIDYLPLALPSGGSSP